MKAEVVAISLWKHIKCSNCSGWFVVEDSEEDHYFCAHCGVDVDEAGGSS